MVVTILEVWRNDQRESECIVAVYLRVPLNKKAVVIEAFSCGLPVMILNSQQNEYVSYHCGMLLESETTEHLVVEIAEKLDMLYHDQEVLKLLKKGTLDEYEKSFGWGLKEFRKPMF